MPSLRSSSTGRCFCLCRDRRDTPRPSGRRARSGRLAPGDARQKQECEQIQQVFHGAGLRRVGFHGVIKGLSMPRRAKSMAWSSFTRRNAAPFAGWPSERRNTPALNESQSRQNIAHHVARHVGQAEIAPLVAVRQAACAPGPRGAGSSLAGRAGGLRSRRRRSRARRSAEGDAGLEAAAAGENGERERMMIAAQVGAVGGAAFAERAAAELAGADDDGFVEQAARCLRSRIKAVMARSMVRHLIGRPVLMSSPAPVPWKSQPQS